MPGTSAKTEPVMVRLPVEVARKIRESAAKQGRSVSDYIRRLVVLQVGRKR